MSNARIFLVGEERDRLIPMVETEYEREDILQNYLAQYPDLLPGDQFDPEDPRRWLLVAREMGVPGQEAGARQWSLDHLFLDQDGIPTFVECKRSSDTRARREVVAQMLDYAANGLAYWSMDRLRQDATQTAIQRGSTVEELVGELIGSEEDADIENFWRLVEENLHSGRVRLVFVADETTRELRRLVEFLNEKMADVEVLAVEIKQFLGSGRTTLVPRTIGLTEASRERKGQPSRGKTNREAFLGACTPEARIVFAQLLDQADDEGHIIYWGDTGFSTRAELPTTGTPVTFSYGFPPALFKIHVHNLATSSGDDEALLRSQLAEWGFDDAGKTLMKITLTNGTASGVQQAFVFALAKLRQTVQRRA